MADKAVEVICREIWTQTAGGHPGKYSWYWEAGDGFQGWEALVLGNLGTGATEKGNKKVCQQLGGFQVLEGGGNGMESKKQGPHPTGTRQISKPGVRPGTRGLPSSRNGSMLHSRVLS